MASRQDAIRQRIASLQADAEELMDKLRHGHRYTYPELQDIELKWRRNNGRIRHWQKRLTELEAVQ